MAISEADLRAAGGPGRSVWVPIILSPSLTWRLVLDEQQPGWTSSCARVRRSLRATSHGAARPDTIEVHQIKLSCRSQLIFALRLLAAQIGGDVRATCRSSSIRLRGPDGAGLHVYS